MNLRITFLVALLSAAAFAHGSAGAYALGDTLTVIMRPILTVPTILAARETLEVTALAPPETEGWEAALLRPPRAFPLDTVAAAYDTALGRWTLRAAVPADTPEELYDLVLVASGGVADTARHAVKVLASYPEEYTVVHVTDTHLPGHTFWPLPTWAGDDTEMDDFREVIRDINLLAPAFVIHSGDYVNEGEMEDYSGYRAFSRAQELLLELEVPVYVVAGNHDVGGWPHAPPSQGTARRNWWRFCGWPWLDDPPDGVRTQDYFFDFGPIRYIGLEAYINYDGWRGAIYGEDSFIPSQIDYLDQVIIMRPLGSKVVLFYHMDFSQQLGDPGGRGIDLALYGHIHRNSGSVNDAPPVLATDAVCDGRRSYRLIRVRGGDQITPWETITAGGQGENLGVRFNMPNDGRHARNVATIVNRHGVDMPDCEVRFVAPASGAPYLITGGSTARVFDADTALVVVARVSARAEDSVRVEIEPGGAAPEPPPPSAAFRLLGNRPNPFNGTTRIRLEIPEPGGRVEIDLFDAAGRYLFPIARGPFSDGVHEVPWDGTAPSGARVPSGVYLYRARFAGAERTGRIVLVH
ncbi:MAG: metallophosphoesterase [Candidatus Eisenbacteria bacterium]|nr:metallophosphoesterase [Candidatus Eisenbacteria bacterium]